MDNLLPKLDRIVIPERKLTHYALNPEKNKDKAEAFARALGFDLTNWQDLVDAIKTNLQNYPAKLKSDEGFGNKYEVVMRIKGPNGKYANVLTAWIDDSYTGEMRMINAYVDRPKGGMSNVD
ncbi:MAG: hypothetical protein FWB74_00070 [Defluviitaleaceae bacterium]|nr:hypothetical protein [Defluviitaleaceae bacterium]